MPARLLVPDASRVAIAAMTLVLGSEEWNPAVAASYLAEFKAELTAAGPAGTDALVRLVVTLLQFGASATHTAPVDVATFISKAIERYDASKGVS